MQNSGYQISICLASYNGERYIREQFDSILPQLKANDEIVVIDDASSDLTIEILESYHDTRIKIFTNQRNIGVIKSFERALNMASGDFIFLADQDDIWVENKVERILSQFNENPDALAVVSNAYIIDGFKEKRLKKTFFEIRKSGSGILKNIYKNTYIGCCMAIKKDLLKWVLPFPDKLPMHDSWIGLVAEMKGKTLFLDECLVYYRRHSDNQLGLNSRKTWMRRLSDRWFLLCGIFRKYTQI